MNERNPGYYTEEQLKKAFEEGRVYQSHLDFPARVPHIPMITFREWLDKQPHISPSPTMTRDEIAKMAVDFLQSDKFSSESIFYKMADFALSLLKNFNHLEVLSTITSTTSDTPLPKQVTDEEIEKIAQNLYYHIEGDTSSLAYHYYRVYKDGLMKMRDLLTNKKDKK